MISTTIKLLRNSLAVCLLIATTMFAGMPTAYAFAVETYADTSALATGRWVKIGVPETGMYKITAQQLRQMGFNDLARVRVHGYGAQRIPDILQASTFIDDLPVAPSEVLSDGSIVFYGLGPETWTSAGGGRFYAKKNPYTTRGYYFVSDSNAPMPEMAQTGTDVTDTPVTAYNACVQHEQDIATAGESGAELFGEDFRFTPQRTFKINIPGRADNKVWLQTSFVAHTTGAASSLTFSLGGKQLDAVSGDIVSACSSNTHIHGNESVSRREVTFDGENLDLSIRYSASSTIYGAWLNYIAVNYMRKLQLDKNTGALMILSSERAFRLTADNADVRVWDVTDPYKPRIHKTDKTTGAVLWQTAGTGTRQYMAWNPAYAIPSPEIYDKVANQNLHALQQADMVIVSPRNWVAQAHRLAAFHRDEGMTVLVVDPEEIYNEFSSGAREVGALRKFFKMIYDRGEAVGRPLRFALLMARSTYDERHLTPPMQKAAPTLPAWQNPIVRAALNDEEGYGTDDVVAMLADNSGGNRGTDKLSIAVGRLPFTSSAQAQNYIDKLEQYMRHPKMTGWKNTMLVVADDEDQAIHMSQAEKMLNGLETVAPMAYNVDKVYLDAYTKSGGVYQDARDRMFRALDEGSAWWVFIGHANNHSMTHDGQFTYNDINNLYLKKLPVLYAATCDFLRWDSNTESGGEILLNERYGGTIAMISATRPVYIYENGLLSEAMGRAFGRRDENGMYLRLGDIYRHAKNDIRNTSGNIDNNVNRLRYVLMGDPAMRLPLPDNSVQVNAINGRPIDADPSEYPSLAARSTAVFEGSITGPGGNELTGFNGHVTATIYDAEKSVTTNGNGNGVPYTYQEQGGRIFAGSAPVKNGRFSLKAVIPVEIADNYRQAMVSFYALSDAATMSADSLATGATAINGRSEAAGIERRFYVAGYDDAVPADTIPPVIEVMYLNHAGNGNGAHVNSTPMLIAEVSDNASINLSTGGVGHAMSLVLDGKKTFSDVSNYFTPYVTGRPGGTIRYPFEELREGPHSLSLRVWDGDGNAAISSLDFNVDNSLAPQIFNIYSDANPASVQANFYVTHDRPDQMATITVTVYNLLGHAIWNSTVHGVSDMMQSAPVTWNLCDAAGRRVPRGIYLYRATITADGNTYATESRRIAVTD